MTLKLRYVTEIDYAVEIPVDPNEGAVRDALARAHGHGFDATLWRGEERVGGCSPQRGYWWYLDGELIQVPERAS